MPHRETIRFPEVSKIIFKEYDEAGQPERFASVKYGSKGRKAVIKELLKVVKARKIITDLQLACDHDDVRTSGHKFQCADCGRPGFIAFGNLSRS